MYCKHNKTVIHLGKSQLTATYTQLIK